MSNQNIRHMVGYRFPQGEIPNSDKDHFLLVGEYTESRWFNLDGTKVRRTAVLAHGTQKTTIETMERRHIDNSMVHYRSRNYDDDYFRSGVLNALKDAEVITEPLTAVEAVIGTNATEHFGREIDEMLVGAEWERDEEFDGIRGRAAVIPSVMSSVSQIEELLDDDEGYHLFRRFEVVGDIFPS